MPAAKHRNFVDSPAVAGETLDIKPVGNKF